MKKNVCARCLCAVAGITVVCIGSWMAGFDFASRGEAALVTYGLALMGAGIGATCPIFDPF